jgi:hypothetical protein
MIAPLSSATACFDFVVNLLSVSRPAFPTKKTNAYSASALQLDPFPRASVLLATTLLRIFHAIIIWNKVKLYVSSSDSSCQLRFLLALD